MPRARGARCERRRPPSPLRSTRWWPDCARATGQAAWPAPVRHAELAEVGQDGVTHGERDADDIPPPLQLHQNAPGCRRPSRGNVAEEPVSYTHLTLPTICSV
eukprot:11194506-Alexandrium_andersonii.AAC.1